jgi:hypothetical protein
MFASRLATQVVELKTKLAEQQPARLPQAQIWKDGVSASAEIETADGTSTRSQSVAAHGDDVS